MKHRPRVWDETKLRDAIDIAERIGTARVELPTADDARRFRMRLYDYRRDNYTGNNIVITLQGNSVILTKSAPDAIDIKITGQQQL
jgi:hypothetical protein